MNKTMSDIGLTVRKYSPEIMLTVGTVFGSAALYEAVKLGMKIESEGLFEKYKDEMRSIEHYRIDDPAQYKKLRTEAAIWLVKELGMAGVPTATLAIIAAGLTLGAFRIQRGRYVAVSAALTTVMRSYANYREQVGQGIVPEKALLTVEDDKGKKYPVAKDFEVIKKSGSGFGFLWDKFSCHFTLDRELNFTTIAANERYLNNLLRARGHVFLNEVYDAFDVSRTSEGQIIGWSLGFNKDLDASGHVVMPEIHLTPVLSKSGDNEIFIEVNPMGVIWKLI